MINGLYCLPNYCAQIINHVELNEYNETLFSLFNISQSKFYYWIIHIERDDKQLPYQGGQIICLNKVTNLNE